MKFEYYFKFLGVRSGSTNGHDWNLLQVEDDDGYRWNFFIDKDEVEQYKSLARDDSILCRVNAHYDLKNKRYVFQLAEE